MKEERARRRAEHEVGKVGDGRLNARAREGANQPPCRFRLAYIGTYMWPWSVPHPTSTAHIHGGIFGGCGYVSREGASPSGLESFPNPNLNWLFSSARQNGMCRAPLGMSAANLVGSPGRTRRLDLHPRGQSCPLEAVQGDASIADRRPPRILPEARRQRDAAYDGGAGQCSLCLPAARRTLHGPHHQPPVQHPTGH